MSERKNISIRKDQAKWIKENDISLSRLVQKCIDGRMEGEGYEIDIDVEKILEDFKKEIGKKESGNGEEGK